MKNLAMVPVLLLLTSSAFAGWSEKIGCSVQRGSVDDLTTSSESVVAQLDMDGPHNGETGTVEIKSSLLPSYTITLNKVSSGRTDAVQLVTKLNKKMIALSSVDLQQSKEVVNKFVSKNGDYQFSITCSSIND